MADTKAADGSHFTSRIRPGQNPQPWFFVPDTGAPGGSARLLGPTGVHDCTNTQITDPEADPFGARVGFQVPEPFTVPGDYTLEVTQPAGGKGADVVTTYTIHVTDETEN